MRTHCSYHQLLNLTLIVVALASYPALLSAGISCEGLASVAAPHVAVVEAQRIAAGGFTASPGTPGTAAQVYKQLPEFCRVSLVLTPVPGSHIRAEVWMPSPPQWNGKLQAVGNGAWAGAISYPAMAAALTAGYATASTDTGHEGNTVEFAEGHPEQLIDFAWRGVHEMTSAAKVTIETYYGSAPKLSYWNGCSTGGRQALAEAQRFPGDYDGIVAGDPANYVTRTQGAQVWTAAISHVNETGYIPPEKYSALHKAALERCDALDGLKDGIIDDPKRCQFDPVEAACKGADTPSCLTPAQVEVARRTYAGPGNFPGLEPGSELGWATLSGPKPLDLALDTYRLLVFHDPKWNYLTFSPERDEARADKTIGGLMNSIDPDLRPFFSHGGKLIQYHGWADPGIAPRNSVNYYESVARTVGDSAPNSYRLFMVPGMGHCGGGDGFTTFDMVSALDQWRSEGKAPAQIAASKKVNGATQTRPLCPFPQVAVYKGEGPTEQSESFSCNLRK